MSVFEVILVRIFPAFSRIRTEYGKIRSISPYSVQMWENGDQNYSEYGHFLRSDLLLMPSIIKVIKLLLVMRARSAKLNGHFQQWGEWKHETNTVWKMSNYGVFSGRSTGKYEPEKTLYSYLDTFHSVKKYLTRWLYLIFIKAYITAEINFVEAWNTVSFEKIRFKSTQVSISGNVEAPQFQKLSVVSNMVAHF